MGILMSIFLLKFTNPLSPPITSHKHTAVKIYVLVCRAIFGIFSTVHNINNYYFTGKHFKL